MKKARRRQLQARSATSPTSRSRTPTWKLPFYKPEEGSAEASTWPSAARAGGFMPVRRQKSMSVPVPPLETLKAMLDGSGDREISTHHGLVRIISQLAKDKELGRASSPIVRTRPAPSAWKACSASSASTSVGQLYEPVDKDQVMFYREDKKGQILEEGNQRGRRHVQLDCRRYLLQHPITSRCCVPTSSIRCSASSASATWPGPPATAARNGFLIGGTAGRTHAERRRPAARGTATATCWPRPSRNCRTYDPTYAYELVIIREGSRQMIEEQQDILPHHRDERELRPAGRRRRAEEGIIKGMYLLEEDKKEAAHHVQLVGLRHHPARSRGSGQAAAQTTSASAPTSERAELQRAASRRPCRRAPEPLASGPEAEAELRRGVPGRRGSVIASTDYMKLYAEQIRQWVPP